MPALVAVTMTIMMVITKTRMRLVNDNDREQHPRGTDVMIVGGLQSGDIALTHLHRHPPDGLTRRTNIAISLIGSATGF